MKRSHRRSSAPGAEIIRFPGQYYDAETGLHYNRFRYYDPSIGRYIPADPIRQFALINSPGNDLIFGGVDANLYGYVLGNPVNFLDFLGLVTFKPNVPQNTLSPNVSREFDLFESVAINKGVPEPVITSTTDVDPLRVPGSLHPSGNACDIRGNTLTDKEQDDFAKALADALGDDFDVVSEHFGSNPASDHIHVEYDPRPGKTSNFSTKNRP